MNKQVAVTIFLVIILILWITGNERTYTVQPGDNLSKIASAHGTTVQELIELNAERYPSLKTNPGLIEPGWVLVIPGTDKLRPIAVWVKTHLAVQGLGGKAPVTSHHQPISHPAPTSVPKLVVGMPDAETEILEMFNEERESRGLSALVMDEGLRNQARQRSRDMLERGYFSHFDPETGEPLANTAEIIAKRCGFNLGDTRGLAKQWWRSPGHYQVIVGSFGRVGIGIATGKGCTIITAQFLP